MADTEQRRTGGPLAGIKVVELAHIMAGPVCGLMLADMGADVVKVEKIPGGDDSRRMVPPTINDESAAYMAMNRNKRGIALDLKTDDGKQVLRRLIAGADVVIENYRRGTMEKLGFGYEAMRAINPGIVFCEISGFGRSGPLADHGGFDLIAQGMSGLMSITGEGPGRPPVKVGAPVTDITAGLLGAMGVMAALVERQRTGEGQRVDTSLFEAGIIHTYWQSAIRFATGVSPGPMGSAHPLNGPYQAFPTADGWITVGAANQTNWLRLTEALDARSLQDDPRFADNPGRMRHLAELDELLSAILRRRTTAEWLAVLEAAGVPAGPVLSIADMHEHPHTLARDMVVEVEHSRAGPVKTLGLPIKFSRTPGGVRGPAPAFGEHSRAVLAELGYDQDAVEAMERARVVA
ncbi:CaiB/BaiF CoA transferase family protein [Azospirillum sp. CT11-132]|jgi:crotonobetainyl-CoA:carnitine CoA-transferase CaiB-like acyl-CoA transferase|uniref:CaiB/BaiF CoA transferase family protein n=1 Tax=unclassified Azospirillum TaxID=2630922 RepID=UPI000D61F4B1|nr:MULTISPECIES: CaiB/BaiF CoA-transferase family protein [unclassified Azospirillum]PWC55465.1 CoA-transferase [Azospirillum sp. TSH7]PWC62153.1 CoA-transferase [Azospirillum sp. TSH20]QCG94327.1 CoA transferase [Azospirillum sp. TSA2s]